MFDINMEIISESQGPVSVSYQGDSLPKHRLWYRYSRWLMILALLIADLASFILVIVIAVGIRTVVLGNVVLAPFFQIITLIVIFPCLYFLQGLYPAIGISPVEENKAIDYWYQLGFYRLDFDYLPYAYSPFLFAYSIHLELGTCPWVCSSSTVPGPQGFY